MKKAVLYARVSSKEQEREGFSIPAQRKYLHTFADENGLEIVAEFCEAETAKRAGRKKFQEMIDFLNAHPEVRDVLVEKTDRLYRNFKDYTGLDVDRLGLRVHLVKEGEIMSKDSKSHQKFIHGIKVLMAKNYSDNLSEEVRKGRTEKAEQGLWPNLELSGAAPSYRRVSCRILSRQIYYGHFHWDGKLYQGKHTPLISKNLFDQTQEAMGRRQKPKAVKHDSTYGELLTCGHCSCAITADHKTKKSGKRYTYYRCTNGKRVCSSVVYLREEKLDEAFSDAQKAVKLTTEAVELTRRALLESAKLETEFHQRSSENLNREIANLQRRIERCYTDHIDGKITPEEWEARTASWKA